MRLLVALAAAFLGSFHAAAVSAVAEDKAATESASPQPPGIVIDHWAASTGQYIGSPSIAALPDGNYVASHDLFGPKSTENSVAFTQVFGSGDRGKTWRHLSDIHGAFWSSLFVHRDRLYLIGPSKGYGPVVIRRSDDGGRTWTEPKDQDTGLLFTNGKFHTAPMPVIVHNGRIWRTMESTTDPSKWAPMFQSHMLSAPEDADLLRASSWTISNPVVSDLKWLDGKFHGWLEGNAVVAPDGNLVNILRVDLPLDNEKAAVIRISPDGKNAVFDPAAGFIDFPGGSKKFTIRFDPMTKEYCTLTNAVLPNDRKSAPSATRNTLALACSPDLRQWTVRTVVWHHPDVKTHGFQYVDWLFDGDDLILASRTAFDDDQGGAHNFHDANYLTFHRICGFRTFEQPSP
jgi:hypothetical protein